MIWEPANRSIDRRMLVPGGTTPMVCHARLRRSKSFAGYEESRDWLNPLTRSSWETASTGTGSVNSRPRICWTWPSTCLMAGGVGPSEPVEVGWGGERRHSRSIAACAERGPVGAGDAVSGADGTGAPVPDPKGSDPDPVHADPRRTTASRAAASARARAITGEAPPR